MIAQLGLHLAIACVLAGRVSSEGLAQDDPDAFPVRPKEQDNSTNRSIQRPTLPRESRDGNRSPSFSDDSATFPDPGTSREPRSPFSSPRNERTDAPFREPKRGAPEQPKTLRGKDSPGREPVVYEEPVTLDDGATINPAVLKDVVDNTLGLRPEDAEPYFRILDLVRRVSLKDLRLCALDFRQDRRETDPDAAEWPEDRFRAFFDLFMNPKEYRGQAVTIHGNLRRLIAYDPGPNTFGLKKVYEGWVYSWDSQGNPVVVVFTKNPLNLPLGGDLNEEVLLTGYFFKHYGYRAQDTTRKAPMILASELSWRPATPPYRRWSVPWWAYAWLALFLTAFMMAVWILAYREGRFARSETMQRYFPELPPPQNLDDGHHRDWGDRSPLH